MTVSISRQIDSIIAHAYAVGWQSEAFAHQIPEIAAGRDEYIHLRSPFGEGFPARRPVRVWQSIQEPIFPLQYAYHRNAQLGFQMPHQANQKRVREADDVRLGLSLQPRNEFIKLPPLIALFAAQHRESDLTQVGGAGLGRFA